MTLDKLAISVEGKELALVDGMALDGGSTVIHFQRQFAAAHILTLQLKAVDGVVHLAVHAFAVPWHQFSQQYSAQSQALLAKPELAQNPELYQQALTFSRTERLRVLSPLALRQLSGEMVTDGLPLSRIGSALNRVSVSACWYSSGFCASSGFASSA
jgi:hypothetical protein